jgi:hypothetical protein
MRAGAAAGAIATMLLLACEAFRSSSPDSSGSDAAAPDSATPSGGDASTLGAVGSVAVDPGAYAIAVDADSIYWTNSKTGEVRAIAKPGKTTTYPGVIATIEEAGEIVADNDDVYFGATTSGCSGATTNDSPVRRWNKASKQLAPVPNHCADGSVVSMRMNLTELTVVQANIQDNFYSVTLVTTPNAGLVESTTQLSRIGCAASFGAYVYWSDSGAHQIGDQGPQPSGGTGKGVFANTDAVDMIADASYLYWLTPNGEVLRQKHGTALASPETVSSDPGDSGRLALFQSKVYWTNKSEGRVLSAPQGGGPALHVAAEQKQPFAIVVDADGVYWTNRDDGSVMMAPRTP